MSVHDLEIKGFYAPVGLKQYRTTHIQILELRGSEIIFRFRDEFRAHFMSMTELLKSYERLRW